MRVGVKYFETAFGGLGGCPFTKIAGGNVCTEDFVHMLQRMGHRPDIRLDALIELAKDAGALLRPRHGGARLEVGAHPGRCDGQDSAVRTCRQSLIVDRLESPETPLMKLLDGVRVLDMTNVLAGPFATLHLALAGAEVIKIENPEGGDLARKLGNVPELNQQLMGTSFLAQNTNKKSLTLNLKDEDGQGDLPEARRRRPTSWWRTSGPASLARLGFPWEQLHEMNPRLIYCAISGFGQTGPDADKPAYDQIIQGLSGVMAINGDERLNPLRAGFPVCDTVGGLNAAFAMMGALYYRERTGRGQFIDVAMIDSVMPLLGWVAANWLIGGKPPQLMGNDNMTAAPVGHVPHGRRVHQHRRERAEAVGERSATCSALPELKTDERFAEARRAQGQPQGAHARSSRRSSRRSRPPTGSRRSTRAASRRATSCRCRTRSTQPQVAHRSTIQTIEEPGIGPLRLFNLTREVLRDAGQPRRRRRRGSRRTPAELLQEVSATPTRQVARLQAPGKSSDDAE